MPHLVMALLASLEGHDLFHDYYQFWYNQKGVHCCDERHCRPVEPGELRWNNELQLWEILIKDEWRKIEASRYVIDDGGLGPFASICMEGGYIFCFDPPEASF